MRFVCLFVALLLAPSSALSGKDPAWRFEALGRVVAVSDVHGSLVELSDLLVAAGLIDDTRHWSGGSDHLVILGDFVDRGPEVRGVLDLVRSLQVEAEAAGGRVHVLLGNHEVMNLVGDLRYVAPASLLPFADRDRPRDREAALRRLRDRHRLSKEEANEAGARLFPPGFFGFAEAMSREGEYGEWLIEQPILVVIDRVVFVHGGLAPVLAEVDPGQINRRARRELDDVLRLQANLERQDVIAPEMPWGEQLAIVSSLVDGSRRSAVSSPAHLRVAEDARRLIELVQEGLAFRDDGPLWYRGTALAPERDEAKRVDELLTHLGGRAVVIGHTPSHTTRVATRFDRRVILADTGMSEPPGEGRAAAVLLEDERLFGFYPGEGPHLLQGSPPARRIVYGEEAEQALAGHVVDREAVGTGSTEPDQITVGPVGATVRAIWKTVDEPPPAAGPAKASRDRYEHEVAAYRVDRLLGLGLVPPTVEREVESQPGSAQLWIEGAISEATRRDEDLPPTDDRAYRRDLRRIEAFDYLIGNLERSPTNLLVTPWDWRIYAIDHSRAFVPDPELPIPAPEPEAEDPELLERLEALTPEILRAEIGELLEGDQLAALLTRRDRLVQVWTPP